MSRHLERLVQLHPIVRARSDGKCAQRKRAPEQLSMRCSHSVRARLLLCCQPTNIRVQIALCQAR
jgi:hypothetical protein